VAIETALMNLLKTNTAVAALVGDRIKPWSDLASTPRPMITYHRVTTNRDITNDGPTGQSIVHLQLDMWADQMTQAWACADAVRVAINGYSGTVGTQQIDCIRITDQQDGNNVAVLPGQSKPTQRVTLDLTICHHEF
jgi:hypothetical protein